MTLVGRLGTDPEVQQSANGGSFVKYSVGTSYGPKDNRQTSWFRVAAFPPEGSAQREYVMGLAKGYAQQLSTLPALAEGRDMESLVERSWQTDACNIRTLVYLAGGSAMRIYDEA